MRNRRIRNGVFRNDRKFCSGIYHEMKQINAFPCVGISEKQTTKVAVPL